MGIVTEALLKSLPEGCTSAFFSFLFSFLSSSSSFLSFLLSFFISFLFSFLFYSLITHQRFRLYAEVFEKLHFSLPHLLLRVLAPAGNGQNSKLASTFVYVHTDYVVVQDPWFNIFFLCLGYDNVR